MSNPKNRGVGHHRYDRVAGRPWEQWKFDRPNHKPPKKAFLKSGRRFKNCKEGK